MRLSFALAGLALLAAPGPSLVHGEPLAEAWMSESELRDELGGTAIDGHYRNGATFKEDYAADGRLDYRDEHRTSGGRWSVVNGSFCTIYDADPTGGCFRVRRSGANCFEFYFVARTVEEARTPRAPDWTARGWRRGRPSTCVDGANV